MRSPDLRRAPHAVTLVLAPPLELPPGFTYPRRFLDWRYHGLPETYPWYLYADGQLSAAARTVQRLCPHLQLVPFAGRDDRAEISCFLADGRVTTVDLETEPGESGVLVAGFDAWLDDAVRDHGDWFERT